MNRIVKISCFRPGQARYVFENGEEVSMIWGYGSYTENHFPKSKKFDDQEWESTTVEIWGETPSVREYLEKKYGSWPTSQTPVDDIPEILETIRRMK